MEQYLLQLPKRLAQEVRTGIANGDSANVEMVSGADNKHFKLQVNGKEYPAKILTDKEEEQKLLETQEEVSSGVTPPNTNVVKRKYEKTKKYTPFPVRLIGLSVHFDTLMPYASKNDVARVEEDLVKIIQGGAIEDVHEELVDFYDWMADADHPNGILITDEMELIREHPEYLTLSAEPPTKQQKTSPLSAGTSTMPGTANASALNTPLVTDIGSEAESQADGRASVQRSPAFAPTPSPGMSPMQHGRDHDEDKEVDMLEDDILDGMDTKPAAPEPPRQVYLSDPAYLKLLPIREKLQKSLRDADRDISELSAKVDANSNIVVKVRPSDILKRDARCIVRCPSC
ncbi:hypothetical protein BBJ28_00000017 [Nothophytophthora sp. Chile5]|nr:hypothetical protein BBJ28_00000017 [Nothophytophthora sp. Chile5]